MKDYFLFLDFGLSERDFFDLDFGLCSFLLNFDFWMSGPLLSMMLSCMLPLLLLLLPVLLLFVFGLSGDRMKEGVEAGPTLGDREDDMMLGLVEAELFEPADLLDLMDRRRAVLRKRVSDGTSSKAESLAAKRNK